MLNITRIRVKKHVDFLLSDLRSYSKQKWTNKYNSKLYLLVSEKKVRRYGISAADSESGARNIIQEAK